MYTLLVGPTWSTNFGSLCHCVLSARISLSLKALFGSEPDSSQFPERVVVKVDHAVVAGLFTDAKGREMLAASNRQITGYLVDSTGNIIRQVSSPGKPDKVSL